jgi:hypothetical protein
LFETGTLVEFSIVKQSIEEGPDDAEFAVRVDLVFTSDDDAGIEAEDIAEWGAFGFMSLSAYCRLPMAVRESHPLLNMPRRTSWVFPTFSSTCGSGGASCISDLSGGLFVSPVRPSWSSFFSIQVDVPDDFLKSRDDLLPESRDPEAGSAQNGVSLG